MLVASKDKEVPKIRKQMEEGQQMIKQALIIADTKFKKTKKLRLQRKGRYAKIYNLDDDSEEEQIEEETPVIKKIF